MCSAKELQPPSQMRWPSRHKNKRIKSFQEKLLAFHHPPLFELQEKQMLWQKLQQPPWDHEERLESFKDFDYKPAPLDFFILNLYVFNTSELEFYF